MLKIALLGVPDAGQAELALTLAAALHASGTPAEVLPTDKLAPGTGLSSHDLVLLMGLQNGAMARPAPETEAADQRIRAALDQACISYRVIYGLGEARLHNALQACGGLLKHCPTSVEYDRTVGPTPGLARGKKTGQWTWMCDKCSDPACEHRLLSDLLASRTTKG